ncbi:hypothetical protein CMV_005472 [Castanea mollissima]|uniref:Uncharacterized protein n=1 Tax=Castanea mollissima TaxID=60419 RepID=A0A8J4RXN5_9ROSI|nr:hypothetical protein CMV_005472 [Castanea mollissima]
MFRLNFSASRVLLSLDNGGTGRFALAIGIGIANDLSPVARYVIVFNMQNYGLQTAGIVSNPPYVLSDNISGLQAEVGRHEPRLALDGGLNGMDVLLHLCNVAALMLNLLDFSFLRLMVRSSASVLQNTLKMTLEGASTVWTYYLLLLAFKDF